MSSHRTLEQIKRHYEIEKELSNKLRNASKEERRTLYTALYDELYRRVPDHPQLMQKSSAEESERPIRYQLKFLRRFLRPDSRYLEVGPGDCGLCHAVASVTQQVFALDVSEEITNHKSHPDNFTLVLTDGTSIPVPDASIDVAYSNQLMEHLHPEDAEAQLRNIYKSLVLGGIYVCITPNRLTGPHDVSRGFDEVATGFHLREYSLSELKEFFRNVGFSDIDIYVGGRGYYMKMPLSLMLAYERLISSTPRPVRRLLTHATPLRALLNCRVVGRK